ncbi:hypothetical protein DL767_002712 [Monosporascus sp. MG133]|nr:hypothetical protein DL767_002712 [Monosporascus sp. MG133]
MSDNRKVKGKGKEKGKNTAPPKPQATSGQTATLAAGPRRRSAVPAELRPPFSGREADFSVPDGKDKEDKDKKEKNKKDMGEKDKDKRDKNDNGKKDRIDKDKTDKNDKGKKHKGFLGRLKK